MQAISKEQETAVKDIEALRDKLYGQYNRPNDPDSFWNQAGHYIKALNFTRLLGGMTIAALPDLARPTMTLGLKPVAQTLMGLKGNKVLIVEDVITTGKSSLECSKLVSSNNAEIIGYACIIDRSNGQSNIKDKIVSQVQLNIPTYKKENLPKELQSIKPVKPGSRNL